MAISAPALARARAKYCPRPRLVPVTSATRPDKSNRGSIMEESLRLKYDLQQSRFASVEATEPRRPLVERSHCGKKWFNADRTARDERDARRILAGRRARPLQANLTRHNGLEIYFYSGCDVPYQRDHAAFAHSFDGKIYRCCSRNFESLPPAILTLYLPSCLPTHS